MHGCDPDSRLEELRFEADGFALRASLHLPAAARPPVVVGSHGLLSDRSSPKQIALAQACNERGMAFLRLDHRGCGQSEGRLEEVTTLAARTRDLHAAIRLVRSRADLGERLGLFGSSLGGAVCIAVAAETAPAALVTFAAPVRSRPLGEPPPGAQAELSRMRSIPAQGFDLAGLLGRIARILVVHGEDDETVPAAHAHEIFEAAREPKRLVLQPGGDHRMSGAAHQREFLSEAAAWFQRHLSA
jgi:uncharacterized protein